MKRESRMSRIGLVFLGALVLALTLGQAAGAQTFKFKLGHALPPTSPYHLGATDFAKQVEAETKGRVMIEVFPSGSLGSEKDMIEQLRFGAMEMGLLSTGPHAVIEPKMEAEQLPYAWPTRQHAYRAFDGELGQKFKGLLLNKGIHVLSWMENGYRHITNNARPILKPADAKGLKIRSAEVKMRLDTFKLMGILPTPMAFTELFMALQQGTVDGQENPLPVIFTSKFYEVQKYLSLTGHIWGSVALEVNKKTWDTVPKDLQEIMQRCALKAAENERLIIQKGDQELVGELKKKGMTINEVDTKPFQQAVRPIYDQYRPVFGEEIMGLIEKYSK
ncbi:MAG: DctP family TRAP transporter solute-binding subunit [Thermodesulfobacteriota bacterium]